MKGEMPEPGDYGKLVIVGVAIRWEEMGRTSVTELGELLHGWRWGGRLRPVALWYAGISRKGGIENVFTPYSQEQMTIMQLTSYQTKSAWKRRLHTEDKTMDAGEYQKFSPINKKEGIVMTDYQAILW